MGYIYKITNTVNDKVYVGQTTRTLEVRFKQHLESSKKSPSLIYRAMRKYGTEKFSIHLIEEVDNTLLNDRETYWIRELDSYKNGYNATLGGDGTRTVANVAQYGLNGELLAVYDSLTSAALAVSDSRGASAISHICNKQHGTAYGYQWRYFDNHAEPKILPTTVHTDDNALVEVDGEIRALREVCQTMLDENALRNIQSYTNYAGISTQEAFDRYIDSDGAPRCGGTIIYNGITYRSLASAARAANISQYNISTIKRKNGWTPQEAFDYCLGHKFAPSGAQEVCVNGVVYPKIKDAIKATGVSQFKFYAYRKQTGCTPQEAIEHLLASA